MNTRATPKDDPALLQAQTDLAQAEALLAQGRPEEALALVRRNLGQPDTHAHALLLACHCLTAAGRFLEAADFSERIARMAPGLARTRLINAACMQRAGLYAQSLAEALAALERDPGSMEAMRLALDAAVQCGAPQRARHLAAALVRESAQPEEWGADWAAALRCLLAAGGGQPVGLCAAQDGMLLAVAVDPARLDRTLHLEVLVPGAPPETLAASLDHPALELLGIPGGHACFLPFPADWLGRDAHVRLAETGQACAGSPLRVRPSPGLPRGAVEAVNGRTVQGYLHLPGEPGKRLDVILEDSAGRSQRITADGFRPDLLEQGIHDGRHGFRVDWPMDPAAGPCVLLQAREARSGAPLEGSPLTLCDPERAALALSRLNAWLLGAQAAPDAPPPLPDACRGPLVTALRAEVAAWIARLEASAHHFDPQEDEDDARSGD